MTSARWTSPFASRPTALAGMSPGTTSKTTKWTPSPPYTTSSASPPSPPWTTPSATSSSSIVSTPPPPPRLRAAAANRSSLTSSRPASASNPAPPSSNTNERLLPRIPALILPRPKRSFALSSRQAHRPSPWAVEKPTSVEQPMPQTQDEAHATGSKLSKPEYLAPAPSILLDIVRFLAALTVAIGHLSQSYFTTGWPPILMNFAEGSVSVFFILSGFMIRYITRVKYGDLRRYSVDRAARIYSVVLPALALHIVFGLIAAHFNYSYYYSNFGKISGRTTSHIHLIQTLLQHSWFRDALRIFGTLTMLSQSWFQDLVPLTNNPFWSLSYECVYYALFGIFLYLRGSRRVLGWAVLFLLIGPTVFLMFPIWLLGCAAYDAYEEGIRKPRSLLKLAAFSLLSIVGVHGSQAVVHHLHLYRFNISRV